MGKTGEVLDPLAKASFLTHVRAMVRLGRGVTGNTTFGLWAIAVVAIVLGTALIWTNHTELLLPLLYFCGGWFLLYQIISWVGAIFSPDAGMTGDDDYAKIVATREIGARNRGIITGEMPVVGGSKASIPKRRDGTP